MEDKKAVTNGRYLNHRRKRMNKMKVCIIFAAVVLLSLPAIMSLLLYTKVHRLEKQLNILRDMHEEEFSLYEDSEGLPEPAAGTVVHAAKNTKDEIRKDAVTEQELPKDMRANTKESTEKSMEIAAANSSVKSKENTKKAAITDYEGKEQKKSLDRLPQKVYLTFDDGPSTNTSDILDILKEYNIKATFFVIGKTDKASKKLYRRIVEEGHSIGMHSYTHQYSSIYKSEKNFKYDFNKIRDLLYEVTGVKSNLYRFPGGSSNTVSKVEMKRLIRFLNNEDVVYYDWNVESNDASNKQLKAKQIASNVINGVGTKKVSIVLMHDSSTKQTTVEALPKIIKGLTAKGIEFLPIDSSVTPIQHVRADIVK